MPTCVIWGCLQVVIEISKRFITLYDEIKDQLRSLESHLNRLTGWEELFGEHSKLQEALVHSYINVIRFWRRVEKECKRCGQTMAPNCSRSTQCAYQAYSL